MAATLIETSGLKVGANVDIQRTDGRVHSAVVSGVNPEMQSVTVEWFEKGETKGKEVELDAILKLNPEHFPGSAAAVGDAPTVAPVPTGGAGGKPARAMPKRARSTLDESVAAKNSKIPSAKDRRGTILNNRPSSARTNGSHGVMGPPPPPPPAAPSAAAPGQEEPAQLPNMKRNAAKAGGGAASRRKSNCVKEVERIKQERDDRRAQVNEVKSEVSKVDRSHPNWQFLQMIEEFRETLDFQPLGDGDPIENHQICVCVRKRPLNKKELSRKDVDVTTIPNTKSVFVHEPRHKVDLTKYLENQIYRCDYAFDETAENAKVYRYTAQPLVQCIFERGMATCFAYGQTGSGKTHTMGGEFVSRGQQDTTKGIYAYSARDVFKLLHSKYKKDNLIVCVSFFEIYSGKVFDLLNNKLRLRVLEDGRAQVQVVGLEEREVKSPEEVLTLLNSGTQVRTSGQTSANQHSSRSHAVFQLILRKNTRARPVHGKFSLIDLAGNERGADTSSSDRQTRMEGAEINKSLLALKECIRALGRKGAHLPFRASKLTLVLRDSFVGDNAKTCMIATVSPTNMCCEHTLNTLRYADRVKELGPGDGKPVDYVKPIAELASPQNSDLVLLKTTNQEEITDDLFNFHEAINHVQQLEEEVIDEHRTTVEKMNKWDSEDRDLLRMTDRVEFDMDTYARKLDSLLDRKIASLNALKAKVTNFRQDMDNEESISKKMKSKRPPH